MKHNGNQILIELTILFILVLIISLMFFVIKKISVERTFLQFWPIIAWSVFQKQAITSFRGILMSESQIQIKRNIHLLVEFGASQIMCIYLLIAKSLYASTTVTVKNLAAGLKKFQWKTWELQYVHSLQMFQVKELQFMEHKSLHQFWTT